MSSGIHLELSADSPAEMRQLFEMCMALTDQLRDGKLVREAGTGLVYVFGEDCPDCKGYGWHYISGTSGGTRQCETCGGRKQIDPIWVTNERNQA